MPAAQRSLPGHPDGLRSINLIGIELIHVRREGQRNTQQGRKRIANHRWIVGVTLAWVINQRGESLEWHWFPATSSDEEFHAMVDTQSVGFESERTQTTA